MLYPNELIPNSTELFLLNEKEIEVPKCIVEFERWEGRPIENTFGNKPLLNFESKAMFAELLIMNIFKKAGWNTRWIETYGKAKLAPIYLTDWIDSSYKEQINSPIEDLKINKMLNEIAAANDNNYGGCWDVLAWKDDFILFAEAKRSKKDVLRSTQNNWLEAAFKCGLKRENFLMVEWSMK